jgi:hypothetical protein
MSTPDDWANRSSSAASKGQFGILLPGDVEIDDPEIPWVIMPVRLRPCGLCTGALVWRKTQLRWVDGEPACRRDSVRPPAPMRGRQKAGVAIHLSGLPGKRSFSEPDEPPFSRAGADRLSRM